MAYNYLDETKLNDTLHDSEEYMQDFHSPLAELERITDGKPGKVPAGKPKVTDGTLAGYKRETPKQVFQQLPTGKAVIKKNRDMEDTVSAVLTDIILPNANSGGTPYDKAIMAIEDVIASGSAWAHVFYNRRGDLFHADYKLRYVKDILFEKGKVSEFDSNFIGVVDWMTETDIKAIIWQCEQGKKAAKDRGEPYESKHNLKNWQELLDNGPSEKDDNNKTREEQVANNNDGYFKVVTWMQIGVGAKFYTHSPVIDKVLTVETNPDPRGIMPLHGLVGAPSRANPLGRPLAALSAGKQNLLDFRMQMEQYREGLGLSPTVKKWGQTPIGKIKLIPDHVIEMNGSKATDDIEVIDLATSANRNYANDSSYIRTQIYNEQGGSNDTSVSSDAGSTGFSKTDSGVKQQAARTSVSKDHLRRLGEAWHGRIFETALNIHFAQSHGLKELELEDETMKRMGMSENPEMDYDDDLGKIKFVIASGTSQADDNQAENEKLTALLEIKMKYGQQADAKTMLMINQIIKNSGVDDPEKLMYTDEEVEYQTQQEAQMKQMQAQQLQMQHEQAMNPQPPMPEQTSVGQPPLPDDALQPGQPTDPVAEDRELARQQILQAGGSEEEAEALLQHIDQGNV